MTVRFIVALLLASSATADEPLRYDVVIAGGSTAALAAAFAAAEEGASVALLEPTDWIGGQLTASGVPAIDEAWHKVAGPEGAVLLDVARVARDPRNMTPWFREALGAIGNPGAGWVSRYCFEPAQLLDNHLLPRERQLADRLTVFRETVVKKVETRERRVVALLAVHRTARPDVDGYSELPSRDLADWYSTANSQRFSKTLVRIEGSVFLDATEWGEVLALADAPYLIGPETSEDSLEGAGGGGQSIVYPFVQRLHAVPQPDHPQHPEVPGLGFGSYRHRPDAWQKIWTYRRIRGAGRTASPGELSLQNWGYDSFSGEGGNDYYFGYLFLSQPETKSQTDDWRGGVDVEVLAAAERRAFGWHDWFRNAAPHGVEPDQVTLAGDVLGTGHGLAKLPYIRDTRRSVGVGGFVLEWDDLAPKYENGELARHTGTPFPDTVAIGSYPCDIHPTIGYERPLFLQENHPTLPFCIPLRALTNEGYDNLLVAGKTMAQTFVANAATRLQPIEWSSGTAAGVVAANLAKTGSTVADACADYARLRERVARHTPVEWVLSDPE